MRDRSDKVVLQGGVFITPMTAETLAKKLTGNHPGEAHETLSDQEFEVLRLVARGMSSVQIAELMHVSIATLHTYRRRIRDKIGARNNADMIRYAFKHGLVG